MAYAGEPGKMNNGRRNGAIDVGGGGISATAQDRAIGAVVGMAVGNALGIGYAFAQPPRPAEVDMRASDLGPYAPGEWADDTAMAIPLLEALSLGKPLLAASTQDEVVARWKQWFVTAKDVAPVIRTALNAYDPALGAESLRRASAATYTGETTSAGNSSLMRTTPITLGFLRDPDGLARAAHLYSDLTHGNPEAGQACVLWNMAQRNAIHSGEFDIVSGLSWLPDEHRDWWERLIVQAEIGSPQDFALRNGRASRLIQTVWSAINQCDSSGPEHFEQTLRVVISIGGDTATAGAVAGGLLGARWGVSAIPLQWRRAIHGWPGLRDLGLLRASWASVSGHGWPRVFEEDSLLADAVAHPDDPGVWLGGLAGLRPLPVGVDAVVSLCPIGDSQVPEPAVPDRDHVHVWLNDSDDPADNPNLDLVAEHTVDMIRLLRSEGRTVYLHCADGTSRTPFIAALYGARVNGASAAESLIAIRKVTPHARPNPLFERLVDRYL